MRRANLILLLVGLSAPAVAQQQALGAFGLWGAFSEKNRCFAIAEPLQRRRNATGRAFASIGWFPGRGIKGQVHIRFSEPKRQGSAVLLRVDERTFQLTGGSVDAWAPDVRADAEIVAAMRSGLQLVVETRNVRGGLMRDAYRLRGAATALDAAAIACAPRR
jgi:hypothetical protein